MSYILDALRKSDQLRQRGAAPTLLLGQASVAAPRRPALWSYGLLAFVLLGAGIAIGWLRPWQPAPAPVAIAAKPAQPELKAQNSSPLPATQAAPAPAPVSAAALARQRASASVKPVERQRAAVPKVIAKAPNKAVAPLPESSPPARREPVAALPSVIMMSELPLAIQQELPAMSVSVHAYSGNAADRLVGINNRLLHEGQDVAPGLRLEEITPDGMILGYKGYRFRRGVK